MATIDRLNVILGFSVRCGMSVSLHRAILSGSFHVPGKVYTGGHAANNFTMFYCECLRHLLCDCDLSHQCERDQSILCEGVLEKLRFSQVHSQCVQMFS